MYVDDILVLCDVKKDAAVVKQGLIDRFESITEKVGAEISFIGMQITTKDNGDIAVNQRGMLEGIVKDMSVKVTAKYPYDGKFMDHDPDDKRVADKHDYLSLVMRLMYPAVKTRPDILFPVSVLSYRSAVHL